MLIALARPEGLMSLFGPRRAAIAKPGTPGAASG